MTAEPAVATKAQKTRKKRPVGAVLLTIALSLFVLGSITLYNLGKEDPREAGGPPVAWGDRVERRLDAIIDGSRPPWADRLEARLDGFLRKLGWN